MMMICGNSIEDLRNGMVALEMGVESGAVMGCGGSSIEEVGEALAMLENYVHYDSYLDEDIEFIPMYDDDDYWTLDENDDYINKELDSLTELLNEIACNIADVLKK